MTQNQSRSLKREKNQRKKQQRTHTWTCMDSVVVRKLLPGLRGLTTAGSGWAAELPMLPGIAGVGYLERIFQG